MDAVYRLSDPKTLRTYWIMRVDEEHGKSARAHTIPLTKEALDASMAYRTAFGLAALPAMGEQHALVLSTKTVAVAIGAAQVKATADRRYFGAWGAVTTRQAIFKIVKVCVQSDGLSAGKGPVRRGDSVAQDLAALDAPYLGQGGLVARA